MIHVADVMSSVNRQCTCGQDALAIVYVIDCLPSSLNVFFCAWFDLLHPPMSTLNLIEPHIAYVAFLG